MILLASSSQTRAMILKQRGVEFTQYGCDFDEDSIIASSPKNFVYQATLGKYEECKKKYGLDIPLLVADTVVSSCGEILRKAKDRDDARRILNLQSGNKVSIITCMVFSSHSLYLLDISSTDYFFKTFDQPSLDNYLDSNDWQGKAGACMVEGFCKPYIKSTIGLESTAMGLTIEKLLPYV